MENQKRKEILLVSTPFLDYRLPSSQLGALHAYLESKNIFVNSLFSYVKFYELVGKTYADILNNSEYAEWIYIQFLDNEKYVKDKEKIDNNIIKKLNINCVELNDLSKRIFEFNNWLIDTIIKQKCSLIGFTLTYNQLLPSLCIAKELKKICDVTVVFGGSRVNGALGKSLQSEFQYIDVIISGEGELCLYNFVHDYYNKSREEKKVTQKYIESNEYIDINTLPVPEYRDYYKILKECGYTTEGVYCFYEVARGCWWNKCTFCSSSRLYKKYREKKPELVANNLYEIKKKYNIKTIWLLGDCYSFESYKKLSEIINVKIADFIAYSRCSLEKSYFYALKKMGVNTIIIGIEAISDHLLLKMDKGCTVMGNIQCLKICSELKINCVYNLFYGYPNFDCYDFNETIENITYVSGYQPPESVCDMELQYGSIVYNHPDDFGIVKVYPSDINQFNQLKKADLFKYDYERINKCSDYSRSIIQKVKEWNEIYEMYGSNNVLYYLLIEEDLIVYDNRPFTSNSIIHLDEMQKEIFLFCESIKKYSEIKHKFNCFSEENIKKKLEELSSYKIMYCYKDEYLALPIYNEN